MDNIGDYLYVLVFVGIFLFNLLKKVRKAAPAAQQAPHNGKPSPSFGGDMEADDLPRYDVNFPEPPRVPKPRVITIEQQSPPPFPLIPPKSPSLEERVDFEVGEAYLPPPEGGGNTLGLDFSNTEELKKGIVYSEIFNRKY